MPTVRSADATGGREPEATTETAAVALWVVSATNVAVPWKVPRCYRRCNLLHIDRLASGEHNWHDRSLTSSQS